MIDYSTNSKKIVILCQQSLTSPTVLMRITPLFRQIAKTHRHFSIKLFLLQHNINPTEDTTGKILSNMNYEYVGHMPVIKTETTKIYLPVHKVLTTLILSLINMTFRLFKYMPHIVYVSKPHPQNLIPGILFKIFTRRPLILDSDDYEVESNRFNSILLKKCFQIFERVAINFVDVLIVCSPFLKDYYRKMGFKKDIFIIPTGIDCARKRNFRYSPHLLRSEHHPKIVLYFGSLQSRSGHRVDLLIEAMGDVVKSLNNVKLLIMGFGSDFEYLKSLSGRMGLFDKVVFTGKFDLNDLDYYIERADVIVDPVDNTVVNEAKSSTRLLEAIYANKPIITGAVGIRKFIDNNYGFDNIILVRPESKEELAGAIIRVLQCPPQQHLIKNFDISKNPLCWSNLSKDVFHILFKVIK